LEIASNPPGNVLIFTQDAREGHAVSLEGVVQHECRVMPYMSDDYRQMIRQRREEAERPKRTTQMFESKGSDRMVRLGGAGFSLGEKPALMVNARKRRNEDLRRDRLPKEEVMELLFKVFETKNHWSLKELVEVTQQPVVYLKEILSELCIYNQRGPYKSLYQLKQEYAIGSKTASK
jgi:transcription initiation factor TFIIF subunit beta